jgi:hypothetical protein
MALPRSPETVFDALADRQLLIVSGKGGVGRTTVAALLGLALARRGRRVLVATVGLDDRLAWMLGLPTLPEQPVQAARNLYVQRVVPARVHPRVRGADPPQRAAGGGGVRQRPDAQGDPHGARAR